MADLAESKLETERILQYLDKVGRPPKQDADPPPKRNDNLNPKYLKFWKQCLSKCSANSERAEDMFFRDGPDELKIDPRTLANAWTKLRRKIGR